MTNIIKTVNGLKPGSGKSYSMLKEFNDTLGNSLAISDMHTAIEANKLQFDKLKGTEGYELLNEFVPRDALFRKSTMLKKHHVYSTYKNVIGITTARVAFTPETQLLKWNITNYKFDDGRKGFSILIKSLAIVSKSSGTKTIEDLTRIMKLEVEPNSDSVLIITRNSYRFIRKTSATNDTLIQIEFMIDDTAIHLDSINIKANINLIIPLILKYLTIYHSNEINGFLNHNEDITLMDIFITQEFTLIYTETTLDKVCEVKSRMINPNFDLEESVSIGGSNDGLLLEKLNYTLVDGIIISYDESAPGFNFKITDISIDEVKQEILTKYNNLSGTDEVLNTYNNVLLDTVSSATGNLIDKIDNVSMLYSSGVKFNEAHYEFNNQLDPMNYELNTQLVKSVTHEFYKIINNNQEHDVLNVLIVPAVSTDNKVDYKKLGEKYVEDFKLNNPDSKTKFHFMTQIQEGGNEFKDELYVNVIYVSTPEPKFKSYQLLGEISEFKRCLEISAQTLGRFTRTPEARLSVRFVGKTSLQMVPKFYIELKKFVELNIRNTK